MNNRRTIIWILVVITIVVVTATLAFTSHKPWMGFSSEMTPRSIGTFRNLEVCRAEVGKVGGLCGKHCTVYGPGEIAGCAPLLPVEQVK